MRRCYEITIPGLCLRSEFPAVRARLLADFPGVLTVDAAVAAPSSPTILLVYVGEAEVDAWIDALSDAVVSRRERLRAFRVLLPSPRRGRPRNKCLRRG